MKVLLDENLPKRLKQEFEEDEVYTARERGWNGISNGELLKVMLAENFQALITFDKNLQHQQNFEKFQICVIVLTARSNQFKHLKPLVGLIKEKLEHAEIGITIVGL